MVTREEEAFRREALRVMESGPPSTGDDLYGMEIDFSCLFGLDALDEVSVRRTSVPASLIVAECTAAHGVTLADAAEAIRHRWLVRLRYPFYEAHHVSVQEDQAVLRFITQMGPAGLYVTAEVTVLAAGR